MKEVFKISCAWALFRILTRYFLPLCVLYEIYLGLKFKIVNLWKEKIETSVVYSLCVSPPFRNSTENKYPENLLALFPPRPEWISFLRNLPPPLQDRLINVYGRISVSSSYRAVTRSLWSRYQLLQSKHNKHKTFWITVLVEGKRQ